MIKAIHIYYFLLFADVSSKNINILLYNLCQNLIVNNSKTTTIVLSVTVAIIASNVKNVIIVINAMIAKNVVLSRIVNALRYASHQPDYLDVSVVKSVVMFLGQRIAIIQMILNIAMIVKIVNSVITAMNVMDVSDALIAIIAISAKIAK